MIPCMIILMYVATIPHLTTFDRKLLKKLKKTIITTSTTKKQFAVYVFDTPVTLKQDKVVKRRMTM